MNPIPKEVSEELIERIIKEIKGEWDVKIKTRGDIVEIFTPNWEDASGDDYTESFKIRKSVYYGNHSKEELEDVENIMWELLDCLGYHYSKHSDYNLIIKVEKNEKKDY